LKILIHAPVDFSKPGGLETHVLEISRHLAARGHEIDVYGQGLVPGQGFQVASALRPEAYDIVHLHAGPWPAGDPGPHAVRTLHFCVAAKMAAYLRIGRIRTLVNPANWRARSEERAAARRSGALIAVSDRVREEFEHHHGLDPSRARIISNGASFEAPRISRAAWRAKHGISETTPVLLTIGRHDFVKGHGLLARAWDQLAGEFPEALWVLVGGSSPERASRRLVTGSVSRDDVVNWIHASDFGALPSYYEGCSVALLEMLAGSLPTLAHDVGNAAQVIRPGVNGSLVSPHVRPWIDALRGYLKHPPARPATGLDSAYRWDSIAASIEDVYLGVRAAHC
jgi:glycosyltransferase involved in cell wall biosynthesis